MTINLAKKIEHQGLEYVLMMSDSQTTYDNQRTGNGKKLFVARGNSDILITGTGYLEVLELAAQTAEFVLKENPSLSVRSVVSSIHSAVKDYLQIVGNQYLTNLVIAGKENDHLEIQRLTSYGKIRSTMPVKDVVDGSGSRGVEHEIRSRRYLNHSILPSSQVEHFIQQYIKALDGSTDLFVNNGVQIGVINSDGKAHAIYPQSLGLNIRAVTESFSGRSPIISLNEPLLQEFYRITVTLAEDAALKHNALRSAPEEQRNFAEDQYYRAKNYLVPFVSALFAGDQNLARMAIREHHKRF